MPMNPPQTAQLLGGSPPGMPPANAFDMDPVELERMLAEGWTMYDDGTLAPPPTAGQLPLGGTDAGLGPTGYSTAGPASGIGPSLGGNSRPVPPLPPPGPELGLGAAGPLPEMGGGVPALGIPQDPLAPAPAIGPDLGDPALGLGGPVQPVLGGAPPMGLPEPQLPPAIPAPLPGIGGGPIGGPPSGPPEPGLDPFAYTGAQNRTSLAPSVQRGSGAGVGGDPGGYVGGDVAAKDPTKLLPARRRTDVHGSVQRLKAPDPGMSRTFQPRPRRRP
jgi:hypothetical protein